MEELIIPIEGYADTNQINNRGKAPAVSGYGKISASVEKLKNKKSVSQFLKFVLVGTLNAFVDLGVLNLLMFLFNPLEKEHSFVLFKAISFIVAVSCSYFCNKYFVFNDKVEGTTKAKIHIEGKKFFMVSLVGFMLNVSVASFSFFFLTKTFGDSVPLYYVTSVSALFGSAGGLFWNFFGYKRLVFKR